MYECTSARELRFYTGPRSTVGNASACSYVYVCRKSGREFDPGPVSYTFVEIDHKVISMAILPPSADSRRERKYVHEVLVNRLVKLAKEIVWLGCTD